MSGKQQALENTGLCSVMGLFVSVTASHRFHLLQHTVTKDLIAS